MTDHHKNPSLTCEWECIRSTCETIIESHSTSVPSILCQDQTNVPQGQIKLCDLKLNYCEKEEFDCLWKCKYDEAYAYTDVIPGKTECDKPSARSRCSNQDGVEQGEVRYHEYEIY